MDHGMSKLDETLLVKLEELAKQAIKHADGYWIYGPVSKTIETGYVLHPTGIEYGGLCWRPADYTNPTDYEYANDVVDDIGRYMTSCTPGLILNIIAELRRLRAEYNLIINDDG
jgi:hypothetical protein